MLSSHWPQIVMHSLESVRVDKYLRNVGRDEEKVATPPKIILNLHHHKKTGKKNRTEQASNDKN